MGTHFGRLSNKVNSEMAAQGKSQLPQDMQKAHAGFRPGALALVFKPPPLNPVARVILAEGRC